MLARLFGNRKGEGNSQTTAAGPIPAPREGVSMGFNDDQAVLTITDGAKEKIKAVLESQAPAPATIRVSSPRRGKYAMNLEPDGQPAVDDTVLDYEGFRVFVDPQSLPFVRGASLDYLETPGGGGFQFTNESEAPAGRTKKQAPEGPEGEIWRQIQAALDEEVNPAVAMHGGYIDLIDVQDGTVFVEMGGGCQGCGMAKVTLKQGVERILKDRVPTIEGILDVTEHAEGRNPYYAPTTK